MSRRSSFGYSSYQHSYGSGGNHKRIGGGWIAAIIIIALALIAGITAVVCFVASGDKGAQQTPDETSAASTTESSPKPDKDESKAQESDKKESSAPESTVSPEAEGYYDGNVFVFDGRGYEMFYGTDDSAESYAQAVSEVKKAVGKDVRVYNMVVPTRAPFGLSEKDLSSMNDEKKNIRKIYSSYSEDVIPVDVYKAEEDHKNEYTYFKTDHNWTALGAYYAYKEFCTAIKATPVDIESLSKGSITDFRGSLFVATRTDEKPEGNKELADNPDTVVYYNMPGIESCILLENGKSEEQEVPIIAYFAEGSNSYSAFIWGNNPYMKVKTTQKTGRKLCIIKDSYGCAFAPFTVSCFDEVFIVDPSYYEGNVSDYIKENGYTDVLVINSVIYANTYFRVNDIMSIIK